MKYLKHYSPDISVPLSLGHTAKTEDLEKMVIITSGISILKNCN